MPTTTSTSSELSVEATPDIVSHTDTNKTDDQTLNVETGVVDATGSVDPSTQMEHDCPVHDHPDQAGSSSNSEHITPEVVAIPLPIVDDGGQDERWFKYKMSWSGKVYDIEVGANDLYVYENEGADGRVYDFRTTISNLTNVPPERQKVVGLLRGSLKLSNEVDTIRFGNLSLKEGVVKFTMIGTPEDQSFRDALRETENIVSQLHPEV